MNEEGHVLTTGDVHMAFWSNCQQKRSLRNLETGSRE